MCAISAVSAIGKVMHPIPPWCSTDDRLLATERVLEARDIAKELGQGAGRVRALKGVSLTLNAGELTLLMGPSGSGRTTRCCPSWAAS